LTYILIFRGVIQYLLAFPWRLVAGFCRKQIARAM
jgi:hypothetical protein